mgnify:CR=1 FL=1
MYALTLRYARSEEDAQDIFQQSFLKVFEQLGKLKNPEALAGWVKSIFVFTAVEFYRKSQFQFESNVVVMDSDINDGALNNALAQFERAELSALISDLPTAYRTVFNLYIIDGYSHKEIAEMLSISVGTSKSNLFAARKALKAQIIALGIRSAT